MSLQEEFETAADNVQDLSSRPGNDELLKLYALYKQATEGDVSGKRPSRLKMKARAKYDAWDEHSGMNSDEAMQAYVDLVDELLQKDAQ